MKKAFALILALCLVLSLAACGGDDTTTTAPSTTAPSQEATKPTGSQPASVFSLVYEGVELVPGAPFDASKLPEPVNVYDVPSCAGEGTDKLYNYGKIEVTAYADSTGTVIYSVYLIDANTATTEGLYVGDDLARVEELYGKDHTNGEGEIIFTRGETQLVLLMNSGTVSSIEYRWTAA